VEGVLGTEVFLVSQRSGLGGQREIGPSRERERVEARRLGGARPL
jgi:hypothetical protein